MLRQLLVRRAETRGPATHRAALLDSMRATRCALERAYNGFDRAEDSDLIESYVYEINALRHRYSYLLRELRRLDARADAPCP